MRRFLVTTFCCLLAIASVSTGFADDTADTASGLKLRSIGPALMGGRIADIAVDPRDSSTWYLAVGSGNLWKTENSGITWTPIFDDQPSYSLGAVTLDPSTPDTVWLGTGENVSGRHVGWGDGVYKSLDGGRTWERMGLEKSQHISEILVDPRDGNLVYVAAEGPLWNSGGERGLYKTTDGGTTWERALHIDEDTGITSIAFDPRDPDVIYAAAYQRRRHIWSLLAGGPGSGIYKSTDAGATWRELTTGLPTGDMGKIGLAVSPVNPDILYATIEAHEGEHGFYRSLDMGESWEKRNSYISNGTGPHYYQEIVASPHDVDRVYQMDVFLHITEDGGETFDYLGTGRAKHSDNHALWIDPEDPEHLLAGTDASLYETFDHGTTWRQFPNLPLSQFYKLAVDNSAPFYNILGGAQDLGTLWGPSRTMSVEGVRNQDWYVPLGADGYGVAFDPDDPNIMYMEWQVGRLQRVDKLSEEVLDIQPMPAPGEPPERWNWDSPLLISPHSKTRLYFGSQRLWRSDDRGDSWTAVSSDLTRDRNRYEMEMAGRVQSIDALYGNTAMSWFGTTTTIDESELVEGLIYVGTDDGLVQVTEDGGDTWRSAEAFAGVPELSFINDIRASLHDPDTVFVAVDAHKTGDFRPLLFESTDRGRSWHSIAGDLRDDEIIWSFAQDHVDPDLLFIGAEFGMHFSPDRGDTWTKLSGAPTISFRDITIQRRDNDLIGATFGRGFYVLDDYTPLRGPAAGDLAAGSALFPVRNTWWYVPSVPGQARGIPSLGSDEYKAENPPFGALITYYVDEAPKTAKEARHEREKELAETGEDAPFPGWETLTAESLEQDPKVLLTVRDDAGNPVRRLEASAAAGLHRANWDLRLPPAEAIDFEVPAFRPPWVGDAVGPLAPPGTYNVEMAMVAGGQVTSIGEPQSFEVVSVPGFSLGEPDFAESSSFNQATWELIRRGAGAAEELGGARDRIRYMRRALLDAASADAELLAELDALEADLWALRTRLQGDRTRAQRNEPMVPSILQRAYRLTSLWETRQAPTGTQKENLAIAGEAFEEFLKELKRALEETIPALEAKLEAAGAAWTPGRVLPQP